MASLTETIKIKKGQKVGQLIVSNIMYREIKKVKFLKDTERNNKGFGEMDEIDFSKDLAMKFLNILICIIINYDER